MTQESISKRLAELFELFESGALSKEEYDSLKSKLINVEVSQKPKEVGESIQAETIKESVIETSSIEDTEEEKKPEKKVYS